MVSPPPDTAAALLAEVRDHEVRPAVTVELRRGDAKGACPRLVELRESEGTVAVTEEDKDSPVRWARDRQVRDITPVEIRAHDAHGARGSRLAGRGR